MATRIIDRDPGCAEFRFAFRRWLAVHTVKEMSAPTLGLKRGVCSLRKCMCATNLSSSGPGPRVAVCSRRVWKLCRERNLSLTPAASRLITGACSEIQVPGQASRQAAMNWVSPNFFDTLGISIVSGSTFGASDPSCGIGACPVVVSQKFAREFWTNADPLGKTFRDYQGNTLEVIGVARDVLTQRLDAPDEPVIYAKWNPNAGPEVHKPFVRFSGDEAAITSHISGAIREMASEINVRVKTIQEMIDRTIEFIGRFRPACNASWSNCGHPGCHRHLRRCRILAIVAQRTREIGIRIALGAEKTHIYSAIIGSSGRPVALGLLIGLGLTVAAASALSQVTRNGPYAVNVHEPINYVVTAILLTTVALAAMLVPARQAAKVDPMVALRCESVSDVRCSGECQ